MNDDGLRFYERKVTAAASSLEAETGDLLGS